MCRQRTAGIIKNAIGTVHERVFAITCSLEQIFSRSFNQDWSISHATPSALHLLLALQVTSLECNGLSHGLVGLCNSACL